MADISIFEKIGIEVIGMIGLMAAGWLGYKKMGNTVTKTEAETDVYQLLQNELTRLSGQLTQLSTRYSELQTALFKEREDCSSRIAALTDQINEIRTAVDTDANNRVRESALRRQGLLKTRSTDSNVT